MQDLVGGSLNEFFVPLHGKENKTFLHTYDVSVASLHQAWFVTYESVKPIVGPLITSRSSEKGVSPSWRSTILQAVPLV